MSKDNGYYVMCIEIPTDIGLIYGKAGGDPGMSFNEALDFIEHNDGYRIINSDGETIWVRRQVSGNGKK